MQHMPNSKHLLGNDSYSMSKLGKHEIDDSRHRSQESLKVKDENGLHYYRVNADLKSILPRIRLERNMMSPPQRHNSSLEKSTDLYGNYKARDYNTEARLASS